MCTAYKLGHFRARVCVSGQGMCTAYKLEHFRARVCVSGRRMCTAYNLGHFRARVYVLIAKRHFYGMDNQLTLAQVTVDGNKSDAIISRCSMLCLLCNAVCLFPSMNFADLLSWRKNRGKLFDQASCASFHKEVLCCISQYCVEFLSWRKNRGKLFD